MVEYLKTKKGYFYKLLRNGEKKRISQEEYLVKNIKKNKKMIGGNGKSYEEIVKEVKERGEDKYKEWVKNGSFIGIIDNNSSNSNIYVYKDIDGKEIWISRVTQKNYVVEPKLVYIPVFEYIKKFNAYKFHNRD